MIHEIRTPASNLCENSLIDMRVIQLRFMRSFPYGNYEINIYTASIGMQLIYFANYFSLRRIIFRSVDCLAFIRMGGI